VFIHGGIATKIGLKPYRIQTNNKEIVMSIFGHCGVEVDERQYQRDLCAKEEAQERKDAAIEELAKKMMQDGCEFDPFGYDVFYSWATTDEAGEVETLLKHLSSGEVGMMSIYFQRVLKNHAARLAVEAATKEVEND
jgi:hypothetical protein